MKTVTQQINIIQPARRLSLYYTTPLKDWYDQSVEFEVSTKLRGISVTASRLCGQTMVIFNDDITQELANTIKKFVDTRIHAAIDGDFNYEINGIFTGPSVKDNPENFPEDLFFIESMMNSDGSMARTYESEEFAYEYSLLYIPIIIRSATLSQLYGRVETEEQLRQKVMHDSIGNSCVCGIRRYGISFKSIYGHIEFECVSN